MPSVPAKPQAQPPQGAAIQSSSSASDTGTQAWNVYEDVEAFSKPEDKNGGLADEKGGEKEQGGSEMKVVDECARGDRDLETGAGKDRGTDKMEEELPV